VTDSTELLVLRLALIGVLFAFVCAAATVLRAGLRPRVRRRVDGRARPGAARLVVVAPAQSGLEPGTSFALAGEMSLGRDPSCGIVIADASVSGRHAAIRREPEGWRIADLGSTNGTALNGRRVGPRGARLHPGDEISLGGVVLRLEA
jgi:hypothetical protein